jgi:predicted nucleotidyltransferase
LDVTDHANIRIILNHFPSVQGIYLFGSHGSEYERPDSDVDIALLLPPLLAADLTSLSLTDCRIELERAFSKEVDLLNLRRVSTVTQKEIIANGCLVYCADRNALEEFEMLVISYYQKLNEERHSIMQDFLRTGRAYLV